MDVEPVGEHQRLAGGERGRDIALIDGAGVLVRYQHHDGVGRGGGGGHGADVEPSRLRSLGGLAAGAQADDHPRPAVAQVERVRVTLAAVAHDREGASAEPARIGVGVVVDPHGLVGHLTPASS
jgi:hypothetical protein